MNAKKKWDLNGLSALWSKRHLFVDQAWHFAERVSSVCKENATVSFCSQSVASFQQKFREIQPIFYMQHTVDMMSWEAMCCSLVQVNFPFELAEEALGHPSGSGFALSNSPRESLVCVTEIVDLRCKVQPFHGPAILPPCETSLMQPLGCETVQKIRTLGKDLSFAIHFAIYSVCGVFFFLPQV